MVLVTHMVREYYSENAFGCCNEEAKSINRNRDVAI